MSLISALFLAVLPAVAVAAALRDVTTMTIPNWMSLILIAGFVPAAAAAGLPWSVIGANLALGAILLGAGVGMFALRWLGGGDAKILAALGLWLGFAAAAEFLIWTALAGGLFSLALISGRKWVGPYLYWAPGWVGRLMKPDGDIPYGVAIAFGALTAFPSSEIARGLVAGL